jgi:hypothetical protein
VTPCAEFDPVSIPHDIENRKSRSSDQNRRGTRSARQRAFPPSAAGHGIGPAHALKVETRVQIPLGLRTRKRRSEAALPVNRVKAIPLAVLDPATIPHEIAFSGPLSPSRLPFVGRRLCALREPGRWLGGGHHHGTAVWVRVRGGC